MDEKERKNKAEINKKEEVEIAKKKRN